MSSGLHPGLSAFNDFELGISLLTRDQQGPRASEYDSRPVEALAAGLGSEAHLSILMALLLLSGLFSPWACAQALRIALE